MINTWLGPAGLALVRPRLEESGSAQLALALKQFGIERIVDVGANSGQYGVELFDAGYAGELISIEPMPDAHAKLVRIASRYPSWRVLEPAAAGPETGEITLHVAGNSLSSSLLPMLPKHAEAAPDSATVATISVAQRRLDDMITPLGGSWSRVLLKIDTQGYEDRVLEGAPTLLGAVRLVQLELSLQPLYEGQRLWLDMVANMQSRNFAVWSLHPEFCDRRTGQLLQINALFARERDL